MKRLAIFALLLLGVLACPKPTPAPAPVQPPPEAKPEPVWKSSPENCETFLHRLVELAASSGMSKDKVDELGEDYSSDQAKQDCLEGVTFEQYSCVMAAKTFADLEKCPTGEEQ